jgi:hypothetical protein
MKIQEKVIIGVAVVALLLGVVNFFKTPVQEVLNVGAVSTLDGVDSPYTRIGGVATAYISVGFEATSTRVCKIKNPYTSTSTVLAFSARVSTPLSPAAANSFTLSTTSNSGGYGTSTPFLIFNHTVASGAQDTVFWTPQSATSTSPSNILPGMNNADGSQLVSLAPNQYLVWAISTSSVASTMSAYYGGTCTAEFRSS